MTQHPTETRQAERYDRIADSYTAHYSDPWAQKYRTEFFNEPMIAGLDVLGKRVLEAMCGSGQTTEFLLARGAEVTGLDISTKMIESFRARFGHRCEAHCGSITQTGLPAESFDLVIVVGGLHHVHPLVGSAIDEVHRLLKPGGHFCFVEPQAGSVPDVVRKVWYRLDPHFADNEASIDLESLERDNERRFWFRRAQYSGSVAYPLVITSMVLRVPLGWKKVYSPPLLALERKLTRMCGKRLSFFAVCQWQKR